MAGREYEAIAGSGDSEWIERNALEDALEAIMAAGQFAIPNHGGKAGLFQIEGEASSDAYRPVMLQALRPHQPIWLSSDRTGAALGAARLARPALPEAPLTACTPLDTEIAGRVRDYHGRWLALV